MTSRSEPRHQSDRKGLLVILDGLGDRPIAALGGRTPLQAAATPVFDQLVTGGQCGLVDPLFPGVPVDTHTGAAALMGLSSKGLRGLPRGPVEALGAGLEMQAGDIALRCNFATIAIDNRGLAILDRRAERIREGTDELASVLTDIALANGVTATMRPATHHRGVLRLRGAALTPNITDTDPGADAEDARVLICRPLGDDDGSRVTADAVNEFINRAALLLADHPVNQRRQANGQLAANGILTRGAGKIPRVESLVQHLGIRAAVVCGEKTIQGLGRMLGYDVITDARFTSMPDTDLEAKVEAARRALSDHDLVVLHVKAPDVCSHDGDAKGKVTVTERIDKALAPFLGDDLVIGISCDHSTNTETRQHSGDPVPSILHAPQSRVDSCEAYDENTCTRGGLGRLSAVGFFSTMVDHMGGRSTYRPRSADFV